MKIGVFTPLLSALPLDQVLKKLKGLGIEMVEFGTGNYPGDAHLHLSLLDDPAALGDFKNKIADSGLNERIAGKHREVARKTILLAEKLGVSTVVDFSGCPGDSHESKKPNWVTCPWPPDFLEILNWQWAEVVTPYWKDHGKFAADHGVKIAIEMHPGFVVYNPETLLRLRAIAGPSVGANLDPSHLFWQGIDPIAAIRVLGDAIHYVHAKDTQLYPANMPRTGVLDTKPYTQERDRSWIFRTVGYGHSAEWWSEFISTLRMYGYDYVLSIEHEDSLMSPDEGLSKAAALLSQVIIKEQPAAA